MSETLSYIPIVILFLFALLIGGGMLALPHLVGRRKSTPEKGMAYECGKDPMGSPRERFSVAFYLVAMVFILFDIEAVFIIPWAVVYKDLAGEISGWFVFIEMMIFILVLLAGYVYVWKKGVFDWNK